jgi:hypothetical protein
MCSGEKLLQSGKSLFTMLTPNELGILLNKFGCLFGDLGEIRDESTIISC